MHVLDIAQNSVRAGASEITVMLEEDIKNDSLVVTITDNGCGMTEEQVEKVTDPFFTTRTTRKIGLGIPFFKMAAEMTGGSFRIQSEVGKGTKVTAAFVRSHIDRMPLGDMNETMGQLMCLNEGIDITYAYRIDGKEFSVSSNSFCEVLEGVPLNTPQVIQFVIQHLKENTDELIEA
ncbi:MAG: ATP-binding protein [Christensenellales bacterium]